MSNVVPFPASGSNVAMDMGQAFLEDPGPGSHGVQFYDTDAFLFETVGQFIAAGLKAGNQVVVIATAEHRQGFRGRLESLGFSARVVAGQLTLLDARETLAEFMVGEMPDPERFRDVVGSLIGGIQDAHPTVAIRAYGEMVDLLWKDGNSRAAIRLEELWNDLGRIQSFSLLCAYVMANFYREGDMAKFMSVCGNHSHVIPTETFTRLGDSNARLREIGLLQQRARMLESEIEHRGKLEEALRDALPGSGASRKTGSARRRATPSRRCSWGFSGTTCGTPSTPCSRPPGSCNYGGSFPRRAAPAWSESWPVACAWSA
jgi:hypothetical protein